MSNEQPNALRLANVLDNYIDPPSIASAAAELRRLHARVEELEQAGRMALEALDESYDDVVSSRDQYPEHPANARRRGLFEQQMARHQAAIAALSKALTKQSGEILDNTPHTPDSSPPPA
jgi:tetratricopeptide (TPR) repeat protein